MSAPCIILDCLTSLCQKLSDLVEVWRSFNKNKFACFLKTRCTVILEPATASGSSQVLFHFPQHSLFVLQESLISYVFQEESAANIHCLLSILLYQSIPKTLWYGCLREPITQYDGKMYLFEQHVLATSYTSLLAHLQQNFVSADPVSYITDTIG